jgi:hypothetical protein
MVVGSAASSLSVRETVRWFNASGGWMVGKSPDEVQL